MQPLCSHKLKTPLVNFTIPHEPVRPRKFQFIQKEHDPQSRFRIGLCFTTARHDGDKMVTEIGETNLCACLSSAAKREENRLWNSLGWWRESATVSVFSAEAWSFARLFGVNWGNPYSWIYGVYVFGSDWSRDSIRSSVSKKQEWEVW